MQIGLVGLPFSGKSTVFQALTGVKASSHTGREQSNIAVVKVPDERLDKLVPLFNPKKTVYATVEFADIAGLTGSAEGAREGFSPSLLAAMRQVDTLALVIGAYLPGSDPKSDLEEIELELSFADIAVIEKRLERLESDLRRAPSAARPPLETERDLLNRLKAALENGKPIRELGLSDDEDKLLRGFGFLTAKPAFVILNVAEDALHSEDNFGIAMPAVRISGEIEAEIAELDPDDAQAFLSDLGLPEPGIFRVIQLAYEMSHLISFFTVGPDEVRAWTIPEGANAVTAAGQVHTDLARGLIRAEVISYDDMLRTGSLAEARRQGVLRLESKGYILRDAEICHFLSNV